MGASHIPYSEFSPPHKLAIESVEGESIVKSCEAMLSGEELSWTPFEAPFKRPRINTLVRYIDRAGYLGTRAAVGVIGLVFERQPR